MGIFDKVLSTLGFGQAKAAPAPRPPVHVEIIDPSERSEGGAAPPAPPAPPSSPPPQAIPVVDVVAQLEARAAQHSEKLNWRVSIVDLLKLLGIDSSFAARKELARELHIPEELMADSAKMNMWLHKAVLTKIAENGGNVPADLLD